MKTICVTALSVMLVTAFCGGAFGAEYCRPTGELQEKAQALADLAVKEGMQGALQFCAFKDGKCIVDVWAGTMATNAGAAKIDGDTLFPGAQGQVCIASRGKVKKLCVEANEGISADVSIRALRGSGGLEAPCWGLGQGPSAAVDSGARRR